MAGSPRNRTFSRLYENWTIFKQRPASVIGLVFLTCLVALALLPGVFSPYDPNVRGPPETHFSPPNFQHLLGTDDAGKDVLSLVIHGTRASLFVGVVAAAIAVSFGTMVGLLSGYYSGFKGELLMRIADIFLILPTVPLMIVLAATLKPSIWNVAFAIGITSWPQAARIVRAQTLSVKERTFVHRAKVIGCSDGRILRRYILPQILPIIVAQLILSIDIAISAEAFLSFLGLGDLSQISWGSILFFAFGFGAFTLGAYWYFLPPGIFIVATVLAFTTIGRGLDEILNPRLMRT